MSWMQYSTFWIREEYLHAILIGNAANKRGRIRCADLTAPLRSVPSLFDSIAQNKAQTLSRKNNILSANLA